MNTDKQEKSPKTNVRVNILNPDFPNNSDQKRVVGYVPADSDGSTAITANGNQVRITDAFGIPNKDVIVDPQ